jgi:hypothetical protein
METTDKLSLFTHEAVDKIVNATFQAIDALDQKNRQLKNSQLQLIRNCRSYIRANPLMSIGIAIAAGFLLSGSCLELVSAAVLMMLDNGVEGSTAILFAVAFNLLMAIILWVAIINRSRYLKPKR